ncbi:TorD/DmsD family molecular chaperone [Arabiibacter massiliensis]|uniref:TorD/DmsD family molecular chaperone n=1 Tax=Arabiibacter massiliensis TaxID=1870985 RepID=UPI0011799732|nr:molecular chaperone TorD family protein [Arabiibacter massiliensis]
MTQREDLLHARAFLYAYLHRVFASAPDEELFSVMRSGVAEEACRVLAGCEGAAAHAQAELAGRLTGSPSSYEDDFARAFVVPGKTRVPLHESVYSCGEPLLFQKSTLEVRHAYRREGLEATGYPHEPDDHLATELSFMKRMADRLLEACQDGCEGRAAELADHQVRFLRDHLAPFAASFADRVEEALPETSLYVPAARLCACVCADDVAVLGELKDGIVLGIV